ncbi:tetratricopeptide repeat protein [Microaerobacter geothermalis]|uniref:tetratricopeptide repeat protein n=1 Tax=Microaerobacter geothermalis TaxID=674972 RepID=UPI001F2AEF89|nr:tetratricopeptide repeat protein [Microaerobacter geothermalis]MCF6094574.1 tetratricopeptide repeat protein [Microaerobacter geothermalis]
MGKQNRMTKKKSKVVSIKWDAAFFFDRAVHFLNRHNYKRALKYFRRAVEIEPDNPVNHCNLAGILSEMGQYEESNLVLQHILESIDPTFFECYFYMANNCANMEDFEMSEEFILLYLESDPHGEYVDEAEELLDFLSQELARPPREVIPKGENKLIFQHEQARRYLEEGKFLEASKLLASTIEEYPDFLAARNNLSLAYYYLGQFESAMEMVEQVLEKDPSNIHALCNLAVFYAHNQDREGLRSIINLLKKVIPISLEQLYKLATTLGILGEHQLAFSYFKKLIYFGYTQPQVYHYAAVAAYHLGRMKEAEGLWNKVYHLDDKKEVANYYLMLLKEIKEGKEKKVTISYHYQLPLYQQYQEFKGEGQFISQEIKRDPLIRSSFFWALRHGDRDTKLQVIQVLGFIADEEVEQALRQFILEPKEDEYLKRVALFVLRKIGAPAPYRIHIEGKVTTLDHEDLARHLPVWQEKWQSVIDCLHLNMSEKYDLISLETAKNLWIQFISRLYPDVPKIRKVEGWAAAIEYLVANRESQLITQTEVGKKYNVNPTTISKNAALIRQVMMDVK